MSNLKILIVNDHGPSYAKPFSHLGMDVTHDHSAIEKPEEIGLVVFTGGADVSPQLYGKKPHPTTHSWLERDEEEVPIANAAIEAGIPLAGICRGSQLMCVMAGGKLVQDVTGHGQTHALTARYPDGRVGEVLVTSSHHQMQYPFDLPESDYDVLAWSSEQRSRHYCFDDETKILREEATPQLRTEPDVVWYPGIKALAAQYHPEWMSSTSDGFKYFQTLVSHYLKPLIEERNEPIIHRKKTHQTAG